RRWPRPREPPSPIHACSFSCLALGGVTPEARQLRVEIPVTQVTAKRRVLLQVQTEGMSRRHLPDHWPAGSPPSRALPCASSSRAGAGRNPRAVYQGQLPAACLVKEISVVVAVSWVLPPALRNCSVLTGPVPGAVHTFNMETE